MKAAVKPRIGVLALMLGDYEPLFPGITRRQEEYVKTLLSGLGDAAAFSFERASLNREDTQRIVASYNREGLDGILILLLSYAPGAHLVRAMQDNRLPLALALVQPDDTATAEFGELELTVNQGVHGSQDNANCLMRAGIPCVYFVGSRHGREFRDFVADFAAAAAVKAALRSMRVGVIGKLPGMGDVVTDDMAFFRKLGPELIYDSIGAVTRCCQAVSSEEIDRRLEYDRSVFEIDPKLSVQRHREALRMYLGLKKYLEQNRYGAYTVHFGEFGEDGRYTQLPLLAASHLLADGYGYAAEGDASCAVLVAAMHGLCGEANFSEMYMMDHARNAILFCHAGEGNWATCRADRKPFLMDRVFNEGGLDNPPTPIFTPRPGRASVLSLVHVSAERFRLVVSHGEILDDCSLAKCDMPYMFFRPDASMTDTLRRWLENGGTHHEAIVLGDWTQRIRLFAKLMDIELVEL